MRQVIERSHISQPRAVLSAVAIGGYFGLFTVLLPSALLRSSVLSGLTSEAADILVTIVWGGFLGFGLWALRRAQARGWI